MARLQDRLNEFKKSFESGSPPYNTSREAVETMHRATADLKDSAAEDRALKVGDTAPSFTLFNRDDIQCLRRSSFGKGRSCSASFAGCGDSPNPAGLFAQP